MNRLVICLDNVFFGIIRWAFSGKLQNRKTSKADNGHDGQQEHFPVLFSGLGLACILHDALFSL
jgi:hypothetical protein